MRRSIGAASGAPSTITVRAGTPMMAAVQAAPRSGSPSICASSTTATSTGVRKGHISTVAAVWRLPGTAMRSSPVESAVGTPRASSASRYSCASRRSGPSATPLSASASRVRPKKVLPELVGPRQATMRRSSARAVAKCAA